MEIFLFLVCSLASAFAFQDETFLDGQLTLIVEDNLENDGAAFSPRSTIHIRSVKSGNAVVSHSREWTDYHTKTLKRLSENDGFYQIRLRQKGSNEDEYVSTFTKACLMYESGLSEIMSIMLDGNGASVVGVGLFTAVHVCEGNPESPVAFNTTVIIRSPIQAPVPDTATFIQKIEAIKSEKAEGKDNRSFFAKYWMYIIPVVLILMISGGGQDGGR